MEEVLIFITPKILATSVATVPAGNPGGNPNAEKAPRP